MNITGGTFTSPNSGQFRVNMNVANQDALINVSGTGSLVGAGANSTLNLNNASQADTQGQLTIGTGGTVQLTSILATGTAGKAIVNLNGGTLKAGATAPALLANSLTGVYLQAGGGTVDTNSFDATIQEPILAPGSAGVSSIPLTTPGAGYIGRPIVRISGDGVGATAVADFDPVTGVVSGITVTSPGSGYNTLPTVTLIGGGGTTPALVGTVTVAPAVTNGSLNKVGTGTLTLAGANTYTGNTVISAGGLTLADNAQLKFLIGANGVNNSVGGSGNATFDGDFVIDTTGANLTNGNTWTLVNVGSLATETFNPTFNVLGFTETANVWTRVDGPNTWTFTEATGVLSLSTGGLYSSWASTNGLTGLNNGAVMDPDFDGIKNVLEFVLGGNPLASSTQVLPSLVVNPTHYLYTFTRNDDSESEVTLSFEWGTTLAAWPNVVPVAAASSPADVNGVTVTVTENAAAPDTIVVSVPRTNAVAGKLFGRVQAVK
jgi:autotransporter-associated beta strand protein